ncbi:pyridoxamine 5'-phosphate oxidase family protein [Modestobacter sp. I12A-02628]|uniref:Pyridoxamine 5'-phosphate oxidase family protein n=1 Tax=Goekera deserti TaxID=2497753 RepID=A0A7K3WER3_9ACTN|nr:MSMEG_1061 family FMN-dependent PPOX-type flavoprotein [Goekera deserti]MPQ98082.1 pyridoxamine 5'-phosphate oxidase family protein [Goekera deserti]NDI48729.1 pyridoxamine 5'-phosphate oxidase family protein [Goekera deserti]NEL54892.1 pyridoxamine 5'-phosphate oxidase family protein [Goekera deserti]
MQPQQPDDDPATVLAGYRPPSQLVQDKEIDRIDEHCRAFIELSPFATLATADADGWPDVSPRGGAPGFVRVLDEHRLALPDRQGNNRVDGLRNVAANPRAALLFFVPGVEETLRVYGTATLVGPDALGLDLTEFGRAPLSVLVLQVRRAYVQCAKSVMRSRLWDPAARVERSALAPFGRVLRDHCQLATPMPADDVIRAELAEEL